MLQTYDEDGNVINTYTYGLQRIDSKGEITETYLYDGRGSVVGSVNENNQFVSYSYTAYGELMPDSPTPNVYGYNAEATDYETGLQYLRARYYDTSVQRFVQEDDYRGDYTSPASLNRYVYVQGNPVMRIDPSGYKEVVEGPVVIPDFVFDRKLRSVENFINGGLEDVYIPDSKLDRVEDIVNDSLTNINGDFGTFNDENKKTEGGIQTPNGILYPDNTFIDNDGNTYYCGPDAYDSLDGSDVSAIETSFPDEFLKLYANIKELREWIFQLEETVKENNERISILEGEIEGLEKDVERTYTPPTALDVFIALGYTTICVGTIILTVAAAFTIGAAPPAGTVAFMAVLGIDAEVWASTIDAWGTVGYQTDEYKAYKKALKEKKGERNTLQYENLLITSEKNTLKGTKREAREELEDLYTIIENKFPGMLDIYEKYLRGNSSTTIKPLD